MNAEVKGVAPLFCLHAGFGTVFDYEPLAPFERSTPGVGDSVADAAGSGVQRHLAAGNGQ
jgi:hypothetical protein